METLRLLFGLRQRVSRRAYLGWGFGLAALKFAVDSSTVYGFTGYMVSTGGEFRLVPLPGGRTRLEGTTHDTLSTTAADARARPKRRVSSRRRARRGRRRVRSA